MVEQRSVRPTVPSSILGLFATFCIACSGSSADTVPVHLGGGGGATAAAPDGHDDGLARDAGRQVSCVALTLGEGVFLTVWNNA